SATVSTLSTASRTVTFKLDPAETVTCTFTNRQRGTIVVKKTTNPVGAPGSFTFTGDAAGTIGGGDSITVANLAPGTYTSTESDQIGRASWRGRVWIAGLGATVRTVS